MIEKEYFHIQLDPRDEIFSNFEELAGDNFYLRKNQSLSTFFDFETKSISWFVEIEELKFLFPKIDIKNTELVTGMGENFLFTFLFVFNIKNELFTMN